MDPIRYYLEHPDWPSRDTMSEVMAGAAEQVRRLLADDDPPACSRCGSTETLEIHDEKQSISICAECGSDEP